MTMASTAVVGRTVDETERSSLTDQISSDARKDPGRGRDGGRGWLEPHYLGGCCTGHDDE